MEIGVDEIIAFLRESHLFAKLSDAEVAAAAGGVDVYHIPAGEVIFRPGMKSDGLYFLFAGRVRLSARPHKGPGGIHRTLARGDYFGEETLIYEQRRLTEAAVRSDSIVLRVTRRSLEKWIDEFPGVITPLRLAEESFLLIYNRVFPWLARGENVKFASRRTRFILWKKLLLPAALFSILLTLAIYLASTHFYMAAGGAAFLLLLLIPWVAWLYIDWLNDFLVVTNHRVVSQEKVLLLYDTRHETPLEAVQSFGIETDQWGRWFGFGSIVVRSYTGNQVLKEIENPTEVIHILEETLERARSFREEADRKAAEAAVRMRLGMEDGQPSRAKAVPPSTRFESGLLPGLLSNLFRIRIEQGDTITYRTHWIKLVQEIGLPTLVLVLIPVALAAAFSTGLPLISSEPAAVVLGLVWALTLGLWLYRYTDWHNDCYIITPDQVVDVFRKPLGTEERRTASYSSILGIEFARKGLAGLIFNYGTVYIKVGDSNFTFDNVSNPSLVQQELFQKMNRYLIRQKKALAEAERERMADFIESYHNLHKGGTALPDEVEDEG